MRSRRPFGVLLAAVAGLLLSGAHPFVAAAASEGAAAQATGTSAEEHPCGWMLQFSPDKANLFYPDSGATYWLAVVPIPVGGTLELHGEYPHARYTSLVTYTPQTQAIDGLNDQQIEPDPGSTNPFLPRARRTARHRDWTVEVRDERAPQRDRPANTLYLENSDGSKSTRQLGLAILALRVYVSDRGTDLAGGVPLPSLALKSADGTTAPLPSCPDAQPSTPLTAVLASLGFPLPTPDLGLFGTNPPQWRKFTNLASAVVANGTQTGLLGALYPVLTPTTDALLPSGGFFENPDNKYVSTTMDAGYGDVLVLHGRAPTTPHTLAGQKVMGTGQMRYWSMCSENPQSSAMLACTYDEQVPVDADGYYTIVVSSPGNRPDNATAACGAAWLPTGPAPQTLLLLRNMLPDARFDHAVQDVTVDHEAVGMGEYYPRGTYFAKRSDYEALGCRG